MSVSKGGERLSSPAVTKSRKVLGEVQQLGDLAEVSQLISKSLIVAGTYGKRALSAASLQVPPKEKDKRLSEALCDQRSLKEQYNATAQQLFKRDQLIEELHKKLESRDRSLEKVELEKGKMLGELKQLSLEREQLKGLLEEELDVRKMIQVESQKLVGDIKTCYDQKISKMKDELKMKEEVIGLKEGLIQELEKAANKLRANAASYATELQKCKVQEREKEGKMSESFRGSISMLQSQLHQKSFEVESQIQMIESKRKNDLASKSKEFGAREEQLKKLLRDKEKELKEVVGRLEESRKSREETLMELHEAQLRFESKISDLRRQLTESVEECHLLRKRQAENEDFPDKIQELEHKLQEALKQNEDFEEQMEAVENEKEDCQRIIDELKADVDRLQKVIQDLELQKTELYKKAQDCLRQNEHVEQSSVALKLLKEQLEQSSVKSDELKESLIVERHRNEKLAEKLAEAEKNFGLAKVDVRILTREKATLERQLEHRKEDIEKVKKELEETESARADLDNTCGELGKTIGRLQSKIDDDAFHLAQAQRLLEESKEDKTRLENEVQKLTKELTSMKEGLTSMDSIKSELQEKENSLKQKEAEIEEKDRKIESLKGNVSVLKQASTMLDTQLRDFETAFAKKLKELEASENARDKLAADCSSLKESLQKTKIDLNETSSMKSYVERRLHDLESSLKANDAQAAGKIESLSSKIEDLSSRNAELLAKNNKLAADLESVTSEKEYMKAKINQANEDNLKLTQEVHKCVDTIFDLKHETIELKKLIKDTEERNESQLTDLEKQHTATLQVKDASNLQMQCTISQQAKLIQFLQDQNESLSKKKCSKFHLFPRSEKPDNNPFCTPARKGITLPRLDQQTPGQTSSAFATPTARSRAATLPGVPGTPKNIPLVFGKCNDDDDEILRELEEIKAIDQNKAKENSTEDSEDECVVNAPGFQFRKTLVLTESKQRLDINCGVHLSDDLYLLGCDQGLFSCRGSSPENNFVKIEGLRSVHQMEFISSLNSMLFIEGPEQKLLLISMGLVRSCAEAAQCSQPRLKGSIVADIHNCHMFQVRDNNSSDVTLVATTQKHIHIFSWKDAIFVLRQKIPTQELITAMCLTPTSVIYGAGKVYELDTKTFQLQEFLDETDSSLYFVIFGSDELTIPMAILDVSMSNWTPERKNPQREFLICYPTMGTFVDEDGRRTRGEDISWNKFPQCITYRHPNLYIFHHSSIEVIQLVPDSYTTSREGVNVEADNIGKEVAVIPNSSYAKFPAPHFIGNGCRAGAILIVSKDKQRAQVFDVELERPGIAISQTPKPKSIQQQNVGSYTSLEDLDFTDSDFKCIDED